MRSIKESKTAELYAELISESKHLGYHGYANIAGYHGKHEAIRLSLNWIKDVFFVLHLLLNGR